jgi:YidC/Oxa1 family membrane protein insertase
MKNLSRAVNPLFKNHLHIFISCLLNLCVLALVFSTPVAAQENIIGRFSGGGVEQEKIDLESNDKNLVFTYKASSDLDVPLTYRLDNIQDLIGDEYDFDGIASYYNDTPAFKMSPSGKVKFVKFKDGEPQSIQDQRVGYKGRFEAVMIEAPGAEIVLNHDHFTVEWPSGTRPELTLAYGSIDVVAAMDGAADLNFKRLKYSHLPRWLGALSKGVEALYRTIQGVTGLGWGICLILLAIAIRIILFPLSLLTTRFQRELSGHQAALEPIFAKIKANYKGEAAHNKMMAAYKERGISPFYTLKPMIGTLIQIPILIAIFNMLGEVEFLKSAPFLFADSLAYPDAIGALPANLPLFGNSLNAMPFLMTAVTVFSTLTHSNSQASPTELKKQRRNLYLMAAAFFVLFYTFPSGMVLYWALANIVQWIQSRFVKL